MTEKLKRGGALRAPHPIFKGYENKYSIKKDE